MKRLRQQQTANGENGGRRNVPPYKMKLTANFVVATLVSSCLLALGVGRLARLYIMIPPPPSQQQQCRTENGVCPVEKDPLPALVVESGKNIPQGRYTAKHFDTSMSAASSAYLTVSRLQDQTDVTLIHDNGVLSLEDDSQQPMAEHLMVDIKHVDEAFLNSEGRLADAIVQVVNEAGLTLLSYHCHGLTPMGVSCVGVLKQNYISFHTWPEEGVITLDLCVGNGNSLLPVLPILQRAFGVPRVYGREAPEMHWTHKIRGYPVDKVEHTLAGQRQRWYISKS